MSHILFLNRSYYPDAEATGQLLTELCEDLAPRADVTVVAGQPNQNPQDRPYRRWGEDSWRGVTIHRVWNSRWPKRWLAGRAANLLTYLALAAWTTLARCRRPDVVVVETDPPLLCLLGWLAKRRFRCKFVVYLQDMYPDLAIALGKLRAGPLTRALRRCFLAAYRHADRVVVLSRDMRQVLLDAGLDSAKIVTIPNWMDCSKVRPIKQNNPFRQRHGCSANFVVMYSGNMGLCQGLENVLAAADLLRARTDIVLMLVGDGSLRPALESQARQRQLSNVRFLPYQPESLLAESLSAADVHLVPIDPRVSRFLMPSKLYGVLASGSPVVAIAPSGSELADIVAGNEVGAVVEPNRPELLAQELVRLADQPALRAEMGARARDLAVRCYDRPICTGQFAAMLEELVLLAPQPASGQDQTPRRPMTATPAAR